MITLSCTCGEPKVDWIQRTGGVNGLDFIRVKCVNCGAEQIFHDADAREAAAMIAASNQPTTKEQE